MISYVADNPGNWEVGMNYYSGFEYLLDLTSQLIETYTTLTPRVSALNASYSDSYSFWTMGFPAFYFEEWDFSPYYHSNNDVISNYNMDFCAEVIRASGALLLFTSATPGVVQGLQLTDRGDGNSLEASWFSNIEPDMGHYNIYVGLESGVYDTLYSTSQSPFVVGGLTEGLLYYVGISAVDTAGNESFIVQKSATPYSIPFPPQQLNDLPGWHQITFNWRAGQEFDLLGYNLYRSDTPAGLQTKMNSQVIPDTFYVDQTAQIGQYYYYTVRAIDSLLNESPNSVEVKSRVISLDQGILVVDESIDGNGALLNPTDQQVDSFYNEILTGFPITLYDLQQSGEIKLADLGAYSTVVWQGNDFNDFTLTDQVRESIGRYLSAGGKMLISEIHPSKAFANTTSYPRNFNPGDFIYDYLKVARVEFSAASRFWGALPLITDYDSIFVDSAKSTTSLNYHILKVESITATSDAQNIYQYDSWYASNTSQGIMKGKPVGIEYLGSDYQLVLLSFPLYYMNFTQAQQLVHLILIDKFGELTSLYGDISEVPERFELLQNYPNPFNPSTVISWQLAVGNQVELKIYNLLGQEVRTLVNERKEAGYHTVEWDGRDDAGTPVSSGIYLYRIKAGEIIKIRKMVLLK
jgi:FlgD Ig-like domain